jgi:hypothetical protein
MSLEDIGPLSAISRKRAGSALARVHVLARRPTGKVGEHIHSVKDDCRDPAWQGHPPFSTRRVRDASLRANAVWATRKVGRDVVIRCPGTSSRCSRCSPRTCPPDGKEWAFEYKWDGVARIRITRKTSG